MTKIETTDNKAIVRQFIEQVVNTGDLEAMAKFVAEDIIDHNLPPDAPQGIESYQRHLAAVRHTYGNFHLTVETQIAEDDWVVTRVTATGIHQSEWLGLEPSGKQITLTGINMDRVVDGKIVEHWGEANTLAALFQMGAKIAPSETKSWGNEQFNIPDAFYTPAALAWMATCAVVPYLVFAFPQRFFTSDQRADEVPQGVPQGEARRSGEAVWPADEVPKGRRSALAQRGQANEVARRGQAPLVAGQVSRLEAEKPLWSSNKKEIN